jgi:hypothetical protein
MGGLQLHSAPEYFHGFIRLPGLIEAATLAGEALELVFHPALRAAATTGEREPNEEQGKDEARS